MLALYLLLLGIAAPPILATSADDKVVYGDDDRRDYYTLNNDDAADRMAKSLLENAIMAHVLRSDLGSPDSGGVYRALETYPDGLRLGPIRGMCAGQRFLTNPRWSYCSATWVGGDNVITAGHCVKDQADCNNAAYVFKYWVTGYDASGNPTFPEITAAEDVYFCSSVTTTYVSADVGTDIALIKLDRAVVGGRTPATVHWRSQQEMAVPTTLGQKLLMIGFPDGLPAKVEDGGMVTDTGSWNGYEYFKASTDSFGGNSGSGVFDESGTMIGVLVRGATDYVSEGGCTVVNELEDSEGGEGITYVHQVAPYQSFIEYLLRRLRFAASSTC